MTAKEAQNILELEAPFTEVELKSAHKNALVTWFPAQFMSDRAKLTKALEQTSLIHEAYDLLLTLCEAEKEATPNVFVEEALKQAYGPTPASPVRSAPEPVRAPLVESQTPVGPEPLPGEESGLTFARNSATAVPASLRLEEQEPDESASVPSQEPPLIPPAPAANPFLHDIVPLKGITEAPKVELRGRATAPMESPGSSGSGSPLQPRTDSAITKVRPPKVIISPRLRGATVQPSMPVATVPVPLPSLVAPVPTSPPVPPPPAAPVIVPLTAPESVEQPVKAEASVPIAAPMSDVAAVPVAPEIEPVLPAPVVELEAKAPTVSPAPVPILAEPAVVPEPIAPAPEVEARATEALPTPAVPEMVPEPVVPSSGSETEVPEAPTHAAPEVTAAPPASAPEPPAPAKAEATVVLSESAAPTAAPASAPDAEKAEAPEAAAEPKAPESATPRSPEPVSLPVEQQETSVALPPTAVASLGIAAPESPAGSTPAVAVETSAQQGHRIPAAMAEETSAAARASHHAPAALVVAASAAAAAHPGNHAQAPIARPHPPAPANGKGKTAAEVEAEEHPAGDHALVPALGDRYHPAEKEGSPNTDTTRHFPTRPVAPSSGSKAMDVEEAAASSAASRVSEAAHVPAGTAQLTIWQRIGRFLLAIACVGGVGYGIYWVANSDLGQDPWGKKPGSGGPMERVRKMAFESQKHAAERGNANAQFSIGKAYQNGDGVQENHEEALKWFRMAADQGMVDAQYAVGDAYKNGRGVPADNAEALQWYRKAEATREEQRGAKEKKEEKEEDLRLQ
ncbi:Sel1 repeat-containing protein [Roseimicrobium gellanilyticum]|uniref:Sel1 repeat-containing protein n=1 Tax=Roseimicrobium gellanilyticum TaxID=748857 RepID=A0A366HR14_9BACT|nr:tetratricopeptide repeat protein [Roseimicrobium gellanilyticum]RBP44644.1 Sel1 repeat-containing protein [Roseimicrobium gellanilyticum]